MAFDRIPASDRRIRRAGWLAAALIGAIVWSDAAAFGQARGQGKLVLPGPADVPVSKRTVQAPAGPADYRSKHFLLHTDLEPSAARALLKRLETMLALVARYWGQPLQGTIECYAVRDLAGWPEDALSPIGRTKIAAGAGITTTQTVSRAGQFVAGKSIVYAAADGGTPLHEAVHAYCGQTFGRTGPVWYSEGMAELGQFWRADSTAVAVKPHMIDYLRGEAPRRVRDVVVEEDVAADDTAAPRTGDSWQQYASRWALCHLLVHNPNYSERFRALGQGYLNGASVRFADAFAARIDELEFEYRFFLRHVDQGYRVDLCHWNWTHKFRAPAATTITSRIAAQRGWQPSGALVQRGQAYAFTTSGAWHLDADRRDVTADGLPDGSGRLEGVVLRDYELSEPFALSAEGTFTAPDDGKLFLRCRDEWNALEDNSGAITVRIRKSGENPMASRKPG